MSDTVSSIVSENEASPKATIRLLSEYAIEMELAFRSMTQRAEAAESRIKASQEQEPHSRGNLGVLLYEAPVIPPDVAELQHENAELTRRINELESGK